MKVPFWMIPTSWGLRGSSYDRSEAEYLYEGEQLERALADIDFDEDEQGHILQNMAIDLKYGHITQLEYDRKVLGTNFDWDETNIEYQLEVLKIDLAEGAITQEEFEKRTATLQKLPWVGGEIQQIEDGGVFFKFDWNEYWIEELRQNGYMGIDDDSIMQKWFSTLCYAEMIKGRAEDMDPFLYESVRHAIEQIKAI